MVMDLELALRAWRLVVLAFNLIDKYKYLAPGQIHPDFIFISSGQAEYRPTEYPIYYYLLSQTQL